LSGHTPEALLTFTVNVWSILSKLIAQSKLNDIFDSIEKLSLYHDNSELLNCVKEVSCLIVIQVLVGDMVRWICDNSIL